MLCCAATSALLSACDDDEDGLAGAPDAADTVLDTAEDMVGDTAEDTVEDTTEDTTLDTTEDTTLDTTEDAVADTTEDTAGAEPTCGDGIHNGNETDVDCGGASCGPCAEGATCATDTDCASGVCDPDTLTCAAPSCSDGVQNGSETGVDCGGSCAPCPEPCTRGADCPGGVCIDGGCADPTASCAALLAAAPDTPDGVFTLDPDGAAGSITPFAAYCDMTTDGGGWTLALKANGSLTTFNYDNAIWTDATTLNPSEPDLDRIEAKLESFNSLAFSEILVGLEHPIEGSGPLALDTLVLPVASTSLTALFGGDAVVTTFGRDVWLGLISGSSLQPNCNAEGINVSPVAGSTTLARVRIGIVANQENDCNSPDSYLGIGGAGTVCGITNISVGNTARCSPGNGDVDLQAFGVVFVR